MRTFGFASALFFSALALAACSSGTNDGSTSTHGGTGAGGSASTASSTGTGGSIGTASSTSTVSSTGTGGSMGTGGASSGATGSCTENSEGYNLCSLYVGLTPAQEQGEMALCSGSGTWGTSCATAGALGSCTEHVAGLTDIVTYYPSPGVTAEDLSGICQAQGGVWTPG